MIKEYEAKRVLFFITALAVMTFGGAATAHAAQFQWVHPDNSQNAALVDITSTSLQITQPNFAYYYLYENPSNTTHPVGNATYIQNFSGTSYTHSFPTYVQPNKNYFLLFQINPTSNYLPAYQDVHYFYLDDTSDPFPRSFEYEGFVYFETNSNSEIQCYSTTLGGTPGSTFNYQSCENTLVTIDGCTDPGAENYNPSANNDDGSCTYPPNSNTNTSGTTTTEYVITQYTFPLNQIGTTQYGLRGKTLLADQLLLDSDPNFNNITQPHTLTKIRMYVGCALGDTCETAELQLEVTTGANQNIGCFSEDLLTASDYGIVPGQTPTNFIEFEMTGSCELQPLTRYALDLTIGAGSGFYTSPAPGESRSSYQLLGIGNASFAYNTAVAISEDKSVRILNPLEQEITSTTTQIRINYSIAPSFDLIPAYSTRYEIRDALTQQLEFSYQEDYAANSVLNFTYDDNIELSNGSKIITAYFLNTETGETISDIASVFFSVNENTYLAATGLDSPSVSSAALSQNDCSTFDVGCQFQKALLFLFKPTESSFNALTNLNQNLQSRVPFSYYYQAKSRLENIGDGTGTMTNYTVTVGGLGEIVLVDWSAGVSAFNGQHVSTVNQWANYGIWFIFLVWVFFLVQRLWSPQQ